MTQVLLSMDREEGKTGFVVQLVMVPRVEGTCVTVFPTVSTHAPGLNATKGAPVDITPRFRMAVADPVLFDAVMA